MVSNLTGITVKSGGQTYSDTPIEVDAGNADPFGLVLSMAFSYGADEIANLNNANRYVYYQLPNNIKIQNKAYGANSYATDPAYSTTLPSGYYTISDDGLIVLQFTEAYMRHVAEKGFVGSINLDCNVNRADNADGNQTVVIKEDELQFTVKFNDKNVSIQKTGTPGMDGTTPYIDWKVVITNPKGYHDMTKFTLSDVWEVEGEEGTTGFTFTDSNTTIEPAGSASVSNGNITFNSSDAECITITYRQTDPPVNKKITNTATLKHSTDSTMEVSDDDEKTLVNQVEVSKFGKPDYQIDGYAVDNTPEIEWTVNVENNLGKSLAKVWVQDDKFTALSDTAFGVKVYNELGALLTENADYTINENTLTFSDNCPASKASIVYRTAAETNSEQREPKKNENIVTIGTNDTTADKPTIPNPTVTGYGEYNKELLLIKDHDGENAYHNSSQSVKWYIRLVSNATSYDENSWATTFDDQNLQTLNGYTITDNAFEGLDAADFSINVFHSTNGGSQNLGENAVNIIKDSKDSKTITITVNNDAAVNDIEIYYMKELTNEQKETYNANNPVTISNNATASGGGQTTEDGDTYTFQTRTSAKKEYGGINKSNNEIYGSEDTTDRELYWLISLIKDRGFADGDTSVVDVMQAKKVTWDSAQNKEVFGEEITGLHYITKEQIDSIKIYGKVEEDNGWTEIKNTSDKTYYTITDEAGNALTEGTDYTSFKVVFTEAMAETGYRYVNIDYHTTAKTSIVLEGQKVAFTNDCEFNNVHYDSDSHPEFERKSLDDNPEYLTLNVGKTWEDGNNIFGKRPSSIKVLVEYAEAEEHGACPADSSVKWQTYTADHADGIYTLSSSTAGANESLSLGDRFPQWKKSNDNTRLHYWYRVFEVDDEGNKLSEGNKYKNYAVSYQTNSVYANQDSKSFALKNTSDQKYAKSAINVNGNVVTALDLANVPTANVEIDGVSQQCYIFGWQLTLSIVKNETAAKHTFYDTLPLHAKYITGREPGLASYLPVFRWSENYAPQLTESNSWLGSITQEGRQLTVAVDPAQDPNQIVYYTAIPVSELEDALAENDGKLVNSVQRTGEAPDSAEVEITSSTPIIEEADVLEKDFKQGIVNGYLTYDLTVNPEGKRLSNENTIEIIDELNLDYNTTNTNGNKTTKTLDDMTIRLQSVVGYPYVNGVAQNPDDTNATTVNIPYRIEYDLVENLGDISVANDILLGSWGRAWVLSDTNWSPGDTISISGANGLQLRSYTSVIDVTDGTAQNTQSSLIDISADQYSYIVPSGAKMLVLYSWSGQSERTLTIQKVKNTPIRLSMDVPDSTPMVIRYVYTVEPYTEEEHNKDLVFFKNTARFTTNNVTATVTEDGSELKVDGSSAQTSTLTFLTIHKTDVNDDGNDQLAATFQVYKYDNGNWTAADSIAIGTETVGQTEYKYRTMTFNGGTAVDLKFAPEDVVDTTDIENLHNFQLDPGIYKFVETAAPNGYNVPDGSENFTFYYAYKLTRNDVPDALKNKVEYVAEKGEIKIRNSKTISISAEKTFTGSGAPENATVELELLWANSRSAFDRAIPVLGKPNDAYPTVTKYLDVDEDFDPVKVIDYSSTNTANNTVTWTGLPNGQDGSPVYYFVREKSYTINGTTYNDANPGNFKAVYSKNGTNTNGEVIGVNNSKGLTVRKLWMKDGVEIPAASIPKEPGKTTGMEIGFRLIGVKSNGTRVELDVSNVKLSPQNNYEYEVPEGEGALMGTDGETYSLSDFVNFDIYESLTETQKTALTDKYREIPDTNKDISNGTGVLEIINQNIEEEETPKLPIKVVKEWKGANNTNVATHPDSVQVQLYSSTTGNAPWKAVGSVITLNSANEWAYTWEVDENHYYKVEEINITEGWSANYSPASLLLDESTVEAPETLTVTNTLETGSLQIQKEWLDDANVDSVQVELYRVAVDENGDPVSDASDSNNAGQNLMQTSSWRSGSAPITMSRLKKALAESSEQSTDDAPTSQRQGLPRLTLSNMNTEILVQGGSDQLGDYISIDSPTSGTLYDLKDSSKDYCCENKNISKIIIYFEYDGTGQIFINDDGWTPQAVTVVDRKYEISDTTILSDLRTFKYFNYGNAVTQVRFYYTPTGPTITIDNKSAVEGKTTADAPVRLTAAITGGDESTTYTPTWQSSKSNVATVDQNGNVAFVGAGEVTITAGIEGQDATDSVTFTVEGYDFTIEADRDLIHPGGKAVLTAKKDSETLSGIEWTSSDESVATVDNNGHVAGIAEGTATITAKYGNAQATFAITVKPLRIVTNNGKTTSLTINKNIKESETLEFENAIGTVSSVSGWDENVATVQGSTITAGTKENGETTITFRDEAGGEVTVKVIINEIKEVAPRIPTEAEKITSLGNGGIITISKPTWSTKFVDLPLTDGKGHYYKYYIKEVTTSVTSEKYIPISYDVNGLVLDSSQDTELRLTNKSKSQPDSSTLPETGGRGTKIYYTIGGLLLMLGAVGYVTIRRRRWLNE